MKLERGNTRSIKIGDKCLLLIHGEDPEKPKPAQAIAIAFGGQS